MLLSRSHRASQAEGRGFDPRRPLQRKQAETRFDKRVSASMDS